MTYAETISEMFGNDGTTFLKGDFVKIEDILDIYSYRHLFYSEKDGSNKVYQYNFKDGSFFLVTELWWDIFEDEEDEHFISLMTEWVIDEEEEEE